MFYRSLTALLQVLDETFNDSKALRKVVVLQEGAHAKVRLPRQLTTDLHAHVIVTQFNSRVSKSKSHEVKSSSNLDIFCELPDDEETKLVSTNIVFLCARSDLVQSLRTKSPPRSVPSASNWVMNNPNKKIPARPSPRDDARRPHPGRWNCLRKLMTRKKQKRKRKREEQKRKRIATASYAEGGQGIARITRRMSLKAP